MQWKQEPYRFRRGGYVSEFSQFLKDYQAGHPNMERRDHVPVPPYYYE
jgi:hypothetical protein